jgi:DNA-nicking Smr family endonuclease
MANDRERRALGKAAAKRGSDHLSAEERALWEHAASGLKPLKAKKLRVHGAHEGEAAAPGPRKPEAATPHKPRSPTAQAPPRAAVTPKPAAPPPPTAIDRRKARQIGAGRIEVEARIDLHGMRQSEAHTALRRFLTKAHAKGQRWVLVITGKGGAQRRETEPDEYGRGEERGVLRRNVPRWLAEPELRAIVVGFTEAAIRHGGEGALYVQLRRRERAGAR